MRVLVGAQDVFDLVNDGYTIVTADATKAHTIRKIPFYDT